MQNRNKNKTRSQIGRTSRTKGKVGEREVAHLFIDNGFPDAHRSAQCRGNSKDGEADVAGTPGRKVELGERNAAVNQGQRIAERWNPGCDSSQEWS